MELTDAQFEKLKQRIKNVNSIDELMGKDGPLTSLAADIINGLLESERDIHLGYPPHAVEGHHSGNSRNGYSKKTVQSDRGPLELNIPRDRDGSFTPQVVPPHSRVLTGVENQVLSLYAVGMSTRDISEQLERLYGPLFLRRWSRRSPTVFSRACRNGRIVSSIQCMCSCFSMRFT